MSFTPLLNQLIDAFRFLPGIGPKSAQRIAFYLLQSKRDQGLKLANTVQKALENLGRCQRCQNFSEFSICHLCASDKRDKTILCVVESPADVLAIEQTASYHGRYFVLMGHLSPLDGIMPKDLKLDCLADMMQQETQLKEIILATNTTVEGEATAHYISQMAKNCDMIISRIAYGIPLGSELGYVDGGTLTQALASRKIVVSNEAEGLEE